MKTLMTTHFPRITALAACVVLLVLSGPVHASGDDGVPILPGPANMSGGGGGPDEGPIDHNAQVTHGSTAAVVKVHADGVGDVLEAHSASILLVVEDDAFAGLEASESTSDAQVVGRTLLAVEHEAGAEVQLTGRIALDELDASLHAAREALRSVAVLLLETGAPVDLDALVAAPRVPAGAEALVLPGDATRIDLDQLRRLVDAHADLLPRGATVTLVHQSLLTDGSTRAVGARLLVGGTDVEVHMP